MQEIREGLVRFESEFRLYVGCALDLNRNVDMARHALGRSCLLQNVKS